MARRALVGVALGLCVGAAGAQESPAPPPAAPPADAELERALTEWDAHAAKLADATLPFTQERRLALRPGRANRARGTLQMRRDPDTGQRAIRWHFTEPRERIEVMRGTEVRTWEPYLPKERQVVEVRDLRAFGLDPSKLDVLGQRAATIRTAYTITRVTPPEDAPDPDGTVRLRLRPIDADIRARVAEIELLVDRARGLPRTVILRGPVQATRGGVERRSITTYTFDLAAARCNTGLAAALFELAPPGVPVKHR